MATTAASSLYITSHVVENLLLICDDYALHDFSYSTFVLVADHRHIQGDPKKLARPNNRYIIFQTYLISTRIL